MAKIECNRCGMPIVYQTSAPTSCPNCGAEFEHEIHPVPDAAKVDVLQSLAHENCSSTGAKFEQESESVSDSEIADLIAQNEHLLFKSRPTLIYKCNQLAIKKDTIDINDINREFGLRLRKDAWGGISKVTDVKGCKGCFLWEGNRFLAPGESFQISHYSFVVKDLNPTLGLSYCNTNGQPVWVPLPEDQGVFTIGRDEVSDPVKADILLPGVSETVHRRHVTLTITSTGYGLQLSDFIINEYLAKSRRFNMPMITDNMDWLPLQPGVIHRVVDGTKIKLGNVILTVAYE